MKDINHYHTIEIVCPYCGYEEPDSWALMPDSDYTTCGVCDKEFSYERIVTTDYTTSKVEL